ncbi:unnamed protein product [Closterium sp. NIES-65]|nr:unnamed protein product [Closterium sp. NIES-65]
MADRPHRAVIIYGDGLLIDGPFPASRSAEPSSRISASASQRTRTPLETVDVPALHRVAADGVSGLLALRQLPSHVSAGQREALELAQLLDIFHCTHAPLPQQEAARTTHASDPSNPTTAAAASAPHISWETNPTPMSERFMGMEAAFVSSSPVSLALARTAGFRTTHLNRAALPSTSHHLLVNGDSDDFSRTSAAEGDADAGGDEEAGAAVAAATAAAAAPDPSVLAARIVAALGLHREEVPGPPPSAAEREEGEVDLLLLHVRPADVASWGGSAVEKSAGGLPAAAAVEAGVGGAGAGGVVTGAGSGENGAMEGQVWGQAEQAIQWVDSLVAELLRWRDGKARKGEEGEGEEWSGGEGTVVSSEVTSSLPLRAQNHLYLAVVLGYGDQGNQQVPPAAAGGGGAAPEQSTEAPWSPVPLRSLPKVASPPSAAAAPAAGASAGGSVPCVPRMAFVPWQSYELRGDEPVEAIRRHHPLLVTRHLPAVTRCDEATRFGMQECIQNGGDRAILADRFIYEVAFKLWRYPKYGA